MRRAATPRAQGVPSVAPPSVRRLTEHLLGDVRDDRLAGELDAWLAASGRFQAFAHEHRAKIRKKLRGAADAEQRLDVRAELRVAQLLLADHRLDLSFEAYGSGRAGPDFTATFRHEPPFNLEVTRVRGTPFAVAHGGPLLTKLRQLPPSIANALLVAIDGDPAGEQEVGLAIRALRARADRKDEAFFTGRGFGGTRDFYDRFLRLGAVLVWCEAAPGAGRASAWINRSARIAVPTRALQACVRALRADEPTAGLPQSEGDGAR